MQTMHVHGSVRVAHQPVTLAVRVRISAVDLFNNEYPQCGGENMSTTQSKPSQAQSKLVAAVNGEKSISVFFTPREQKPVCNEACSGCYYFANYTPGQSAISAVEVPAVLRALSEAGFSNQFLITSELLLAPNWRDLVKLAGYNYINTNGRIIVRRGIPLLEEIAEAGVRQLVITANLPPYNEELNLTRPEIVQTAFDVINQYNGANPDSAFVTVATVILTSRNYNAVPALCAAVKELYRANKVRFIAYLPLTGGVPSLAASREQLAVAGEQIAAMRNFYDPAELYVARGGTIGSQGLSSAKRSSFCPAGETLFAVRSMDEGSPVSPCIYIPSVNVGSVVDGRVILDEPLQLAFRETKQRAIDQGYCPAFALAGGLVK